MERPSVLEDADVLVHSSTREDPENELTINARDPALGVYWPRLDDVREAITSDEDGAAAVQQRIDAEEALLREAVGGEERRQDHVRSGESLSGDL